MIINITTYRNVNSPNLIYNSCVTRHFRRAKFSTSFLGIKRQKNDNKTRIDYSVLAKYKKFRHHFCRFVAFKTNFRMRHNIWTLDLYWTTPYVLITTITKLPVCKHFEFSGLCTFFIFISVTICLYRDILDRPKYKIK